jgi:hypothetical protein
VDPRQTVPSTTRLLFGWRLSIITIHGWSNVVLPIICRAELCLACSDVIAGRLLSHEQIHAHTLGRSKSRSPTSRTRSFLFSSHLFTRQAENTGGFQSSYYHWRAIVASDRLLRFCAIADLTSTSPGGCIGWLWVISSLRTAPRFELEAKQRCARLEQPR